MKRPLKVMYVIPSLGRAGMEKVVVDGIKRFDTWKIVPSVCCIWRKGELSHELEEAGIPVFLKTKNNSKFDYFLPLRLKELFKNEKIDVVHSYSGVYRDATLGAMLARVPIIIHTDQGKFYPDTRWTRFNHFLFSLFRERVIAVSHELRDFLVKEVGLSAGKVEVIYNAVDVADHDMDIDAQKKKRSLGLDNQSLLVGIVARLVPVKDHKTLLLAFKDVMQSFPQARLLVIGDGALKQGLVNLANQLGLNELVTFMGKRSDVPELLKILDLVVLSSKSEGLSLSLLEAMASGKPVVATNVGGNPELVQNGVTGLLVPPQNPNKMARAIIELLRDKGKRESMGHAGEKRIREKFSIQKMVQKYENLYLSLARQKGLIS